MLARMAVVLVMNPPEWLSHADFALQEVGDLHRIIKNAVDLDACSDAVKQCLRHVALLHAPMQESLLESLEECGTCEVLGVVRC
jgi:hypothetical protein